MWGFALSQSPDGALVAKVNGEGLYEGERFWADAIKETREDPYTRLAMAKRYLPLPAAFREAAIALRAIIRAKRKAGQPVDSELSELHRLAAIESLAPYDFLDVTPFNEITDLDLTPPNVGWDELPLLNKTDRNYMCAAWSGPTRHTTGEYLFPHVRQRASDALRREDEAGQVDWFADVVELESKAAEAAEKRRSWWSRIFGRR
jgi:hypothetical protein